MKTIFLFVFFIISSQLMASDTICYDEKNAFVFESGKQWQLDAKAADKMGLCAIYTLKDYSFDDSPAIIYPRLITTNESLKDMIDKDKLDYQKKSITAFILKHKKFKSKKNKLDFEVLSFNNGASPNEYEYVFYHKAKNAILLIVLSVRNQQDLKKYLNDLEKFAAKVKLIKIKK